MVWVDTIVQWLRFEPSDFIASVDRPIGSELEGVMATTPVGGVAGKCITTIEGIGATTVGSRAGMRTALLFVAFGLAACGTLPAQVDRPHSPALAPSIDSSLVRIA